MLDEAPLSDAERRRVPTLAGTSHAVFVSADAAGASLRFFTAEGELPACGHGTVAALAFLAERAGLAEGARYEVTLRTAARVFAGWCVREGPAVRAAYDPGPVELRAPTAAECDLVLPALGVTPDTLAPGIRVGSMGRPRLLVPVASRSALTALAPDQLRLRAACDRLGLLGAYVHTAPTPAGQVAARMFAPSIGVPEDIANANSTACLAAHLLTPLSVDMGDSLSAPATLTATPHPTPRGPRIRLGATARLPT